MATIWYRTDPLTARFAAAINDLKAQLGAGTSFHLDAYEQPVGSPNATDLPSALVLLNEIRAVHEVHKGDLLAHKFKGPALQTSKVIDLPTAIAASNAIKADFNLHISVAAIHYNVDQANAVGVADASDLPTLLILVNALKTSLNAHMAGAPPARSIRVLDP
jgi:hypothetical protein